MVIKIRYIIGFLLLLLLPLTTFAGPWSLGTFTQVKMEYQYTDYNEYKYPDPILYEYNQHAYTQPNPFIAQFPENRGLVRVTQGLGINDEIQVKYQYSDLDKIENSWEQLFHLRYNRNLTESADVHIATQFTRGSSNLEGEMVEIGGKYDWAGFIMLSGYYAYYSTKTDSNSNDSHSWQLKLRQALTKRTAIQVRHDWFFASGEKSDFISNSLTFWLSQWLPTRTAVHLEWREHWDSTGLNSHSPGIEIDQYIGWRTTFKMRGRYYLGKPEDPVALDTINGDEFTNWAFSGMLSHYIFPETKVLLKYRHYWSDDQDISMNTYLIALEHIL